MFFSPSDREAGARVLFEQLLERVLCIATAFSRSVIRRGGSIRRALSALQAAGGWGEGMATGDDLPRC